VDVAEHGQGGKFIREIGPAAAIKVAASDQPVVGFVAGC
jgi:hypothetical protein